MIGRFDPIIRCDFRLNFQSIVGDSGRLYFEMSSHFYFYNTEILNELLKTRNSGKS